MVWISVRIQTDFQNVFPLVILNEVSGRYSPERGCHEVTGVEIIAKKKLGGQPSLFLCLLQAKQIYLLSAVATSTAQATVQPTDRKSVV